MLKEKTDVLIAGGGLAGLSLAIQLKRADAALKVVVVEKQPYSVSEAAYKVGESTVDVGSRYFADTLGMREHLEDAHVKKPGLRFYFSSGDNKDVARRPELGGSAWPKFVSYQLDRGMYELFRVWAEKDQREREFKHVDFLSPGAPLRRLHEQMGDMLEPDALRERFNHNIGLIKSVGICVFRQAVQCCYPEHAQLIAGRPINPLAIGLEPSKWEEDGLFDPAMAMEPDPNVVRDCERVLFELPMMKMTGPSAMSANRLSKECGVHGAT